MANNLWDSLEIAKLGVSILTPVSVAVLGWFISRRIKRFEHAQWSNQKLIEKRLSLYDELAPQLNKLLCFYTWAGYWKNITPKDTIDAKRMLDRTVNIYRYLLGDDFYQHYQLFIHTLFSTYTGPSHDAKIRSVIRGTNGDRTTDCNYPWDKEWDKNFADE
jgi:hypothetical protein